LVLTTYGIALWLWSKKTARLKLEWIFWRIPGLGRLVFLHAHADLFLVLSLTLNAGVPLITCLELAKKSSRSLRIKRDIEDIVLKLNQGQKISLIIGVLGWPPQVLQLIRVGEASGKLGVSFTQLHHYFEVQVSNQSVWLEQLIEPLLLLLVATFVGLILIALYLPLFEMGQMM
jgi:type II secretory pathway component PulF